MNSLRIALQSDPPECFDPKGDTSLAIVLEAICERQYSVSYYHPSSLSSDDGIIRAFVHDVFVEENCRHERVLGKKEGSWQELTTFDVILVRQDPPYDMAYITATYLLEQIIDKVRIVNHPKALRDFPEKILPPSLQQFMPPTLISADLPLIREFALAQGNDIIVKPLYGNGGRGVFRIRPGDHNLAVIFESLWSIEPLPVMAQAYLPAVKNGDKRILLIDGEICGAINRVAGEGEYRSNLHVGGNAYATDINEKDREICAALKPFLQNQGIVLAGIDVIGDYLTEINITSPTGFQECLRFTGKNLATYFWDAIVS